MKYTLHWKNEEIDTFATMEEACEMQAEYNMAYGGGVTVREG